MHLETYLSQKKKTVDARLDQLLPKRNRYPQKIHEAMRYSLFIGGKRIRPVLTIASCEAVGGRGGAALDIACAFELIHTYSLIHDDLPCMDNDDFRRGKPTSHKVFGQAVAVLAGDALLTHAFGICAEAKNIPEKTKNKLIALIARASGSEGLIGGQVVDLDSEEKDVPPKTLEYIHTHKTACLIRAAIEAGALIGGAAAREFRALSAYGTLVGLTFQIADDILDIVSTREKLGKGIGKDIAQGKATYPSIDGMEKSRLILRRKTEEALHALSVFGKKAEPLREIARFIAQRDR